MLRSRLCLLTGALVCALVSSTAQAYRLKAPAGGAIHAVVVGVNTYPHLNGRNLKGAVADAEGIESALRGGGVEDVTTFLEEKATRAALVGAMDRLAAEAKPGDLVFLSYAGHGLRVKEYKAWRGIDPGGVNEEIALAAYAPKGPEAAEVIVNVEVRAWLSRLNAKGVDVLVVWDSCFGGGMRDIVPGGGALAVRQIRDAPSGDIYETFEGIPMTSVEARANVRTMEHVTFLAGADPFSTVPELHGVDREHPQVFHGALSYYVSQSLQGKLSKGAVSRLALFDDIGQNVQQASQERQSLELLPRSESDPAVAARTVFVVEDVEPRAPPPAEGAVRLAIVGGPAGAFDSIVKGQAPLALIDDPNSADLIWNVPKRQAIAKVDILMENIDASMIGFVADRTAAIAQLRTLSEGRTLSAVVGERGKAFVPPDIAEAAVTGLGGARLTVFNVGADGTIQMLLPAAPGSRGYCPDPDENAWSCKLQVTPPFGIDAMVAVATRDSPDALLEWLRRQHNKRAAGEMIGVLKSLAAADSSLRLGFAETVTAPTR